MILKKSLSISVCLMLGSLILCTAQKKIRYLQYEDLRKYHLGFFVGLHTQDLKITHSAIKDEDGNIWYGSVPSYATGFSVGVLGDYRLCEFLSLRLSPAIHFGNKTLSMVSDATDCEIKNVEIRSNYIMLPLDIRYRGARTDNYRPYLITGFSIGFDAGIHKKKEVQLQPFNTYWEFGVGCDLYMPFFRLVPELKFCLGLNDIFDHNRSGEESDAYENYTNAFEEMNSILIVLSFQFE